MTTKAMITQQYLTNIADAIRSKRNVSDTYYPSEMATAINGIKTLNATVSGTKLILTGTAASVSGNTLSIQNN